MPPDQMPQTPGSVPVPDPTSLTSAALGREISNLEKLLKLEIAGETGTLTTRLEGMDTALKLLQAARDRLPGEIADSIHTLRDQHDERFSSINALLDEKFERVQTQFEERDKRTDTTATAQKEALAAALAAAKEAVAAALQAAKEAVAAQNESFQQAVYKAETNTTKQIDAITAALNSAVAGLQAQLADLKERISGVEQRTVGATTQQVTQQGATGNWVSIIAAMAAVAAVVITVVLAMTRK